MSSSSTDLTCVASNTSSNSTVPVYLLQQYRHHGGNHDFYDQVEKVRSFFQDAAQLAAEERAQHKRKLPDSDAVHVYDESNRRSERYV